MDFNLGGVLESSGAVLIVIVFLMIAIGVTMVLTTAGRPGSTKE
jgi:hypothetical protein